MWCAEGLRAVKLPDVQQLRVRQPGDRERVPPGAGRAGPLPRHQKKAVSLHFAGEGKRKVQVGYVIESADLEDELSAGPGREGEAVSARLGGGREPDRRGLGRGEDGARSAAGRSRSRWTCTTRSTSIGRWSSRNCSPRCGRDLSRRIRTRRTRSRRHWHDSEALVAERRPAGGRFGGQWAATGDAQWPMHSHGGAGREHRVRRPIGATVRTMPSADVRRRNGRRTGQRTQHRQRSATRRRRRHWATSSSTPSTTRSSSPARSRPCSPSSARMSKGKRSRIYNQAVQAKHPLLGLKFKNTSGLHLNQGPITVFEGSRLRRRHPRPRRAAQRRTAGLLRHRPGHRSRSASRARHAEDHVGQGREGDHHDHDQADRREEVQDHQPHSDRPDAGRSSTPTARTSSSSWSIPTSRWRTRPKSTASRPP